MSGRLRWPPSLSRRRLFSPLGLVEPSCALDYCSLSRCGARCAGGQRMWVRFEAGWDAGLVRVLEWDRELLLGADPALAARAARGVVVAATSVPAAGPVEFHGIPTDAFGVLVLEGMLIRRVEMVGRASGELL